MFNFNVLSVGGNIAGLQTSVIKSAMRVAALAAHFVRRWLCGSTAKQRGACSGGWRSHRLQAGAARLLPEA
jgi:hypothetical protein